MLAALTLMIAAVQVPVARAQNPLNGRGMWIWYVSRANGGNVASIAARARRYGVGTLMIKGGDGSGVWSQFSPALISALHAYGLRVCAWQYVYGNKPVSEAHVGAADVKNGADCLVIDAESEYEGKYVAAQRYITTLRKLIGNHFPVGLAGLPYVSYHPGFPYSVFLGPGGAQFNLPQMYWFDIGTSVDRVYAVTYVFNRIYQRPIFPLGEVTGPPPSRDVVRFRQLAIAYGADGVSWWDWQDASNTMWRAIAQPVGSPANFTPVRGMAILGLHAVGDLVVWAQEHLVSAGYQIKIDGAFGPNTLQAVRNFQVANGLTADGRIGSFTWQALLRYRPAAVHWTLARQAATASASVLSLPEPKNARLRGRSEFRRHPRGAYVPASRG